MTTPIYLFHHEHKFYMGEKPANLDPIEKKPVLPGKKHPTRTIVKPPEVKVGFARVFDPETEVWSQVEDPFGYALGVVGKKTVYSKENGSSAVINLGKAIYPTLGPVPEGYTMKECPDQDHDWDEAKDAWVVNTTRKAKRVAEETRDTELRASAFISDFEGLVRGKSLSELNTLADAAFKDFSPGAQKFFKYLLAKTALEVR